MWFRGAPMKYTKSTTIDQYIEEAREPARSRMVLIRRTINELVPEATEHISYHMPAFKTFGKPLVYFACHDKHIGFYATPSGHDAFKSDLAVYKGGKGSVQFPFDQPLPENLIRRIILFRKHENEGKYGL